MLLTWGTGDTLYFLSHWFFCWRYWKVAELLAKVQHKTQLCSVKFINFTGILVAILIVVNYVGAGVYYWNRGENNWYSLLFTVVFPSFWICIDTGVMGYAVVRVRYLLKGDGEIKMNYGYMALHVCNLLLLTVG
jgi:hypothetical protein